MRDAEGVELHGVDAFVAYIVVQEDFFEAASFFGNGRSSGNEPAIADCTLEHVLRRDTVIAEEAVALLFRESIFRSNP